MAFPVKHNFAERSLALIRGRLWNKVARICSYWASGTGIEIVKPETPSPESPITIGLNAFEAAQSIADEFDKQGIWRENKPNGAAEKKIESGFIQGQWAGTAPLSDTWERGVTTSETGDGEKTCGCRLTVLCRMENDGEDALMRFRTLTFDERGRLVSVSAEETAAGQCMTYRDD